MSTLTGTQVLLLVVSETGLVYTFTTPKLQPLVTKPEGKNLIQSCLNAPDASMENGSMNASPSMVSLRVSGVLFKKLTHFFLLREQQIYMVIIVKNELSIVKPFIYMIFLI